MFTKISVTDTSSSSSKGTLIKYKHISHKNKPLATSLGAEEGTEGRGGGEVWGVKGRESH